jgi:nicotinate-nucleotide adenylyltransferase
VTKRRVAVYGGSFDPPHLGHVLSVAWALSATEIDEVWVIPTWEHAFGKAHRASFEARMAMCELAFALFRDVELLDVERRLGGVSRTLHTLETLQAEHPDVGFRLLIGADVLPTTDRWHRWDAIERIAPPLVIGREGYPAPDGCPISIPDVSSTDIRSALDHAGDLEGLVPAAVVEEIRRQGLYTEEG